MKKLHNHCLVNCELSFKAVNKILRFLFIFITIFLCASLNAQVLSVRLYARYTVKQFDFKHRQGSYTVNGDTLFSDELVKDGSVRIKQGKSDKLILTVNGIKKGEFKEIRILQDSLNSILGVQSIVPEIKAHTFQDNFIITSEEGQLKILNQVEIENYLAGVIESEGGGGRHLEYYKVQALISRTYVLKHLNRHKLEGYNVCDAVHCQAYHNMLRGTPMIRKAIVESKGEIMVDEYDNMLSSYFHANCGGQTSDGSYVWRNSISYCMPFIDSFCTESKQYEWKKIIPRNEWESYLKTNFKFPIKSELVKKEMYNFDQPYRKAFYVHASLGVPLRDLRSKFNLKSTFFSVRRSGNQIILNGKGYGHGVGLCQEGAMEMANRGISYKQIATYYFDNVRIMGYKNFMYFKSTQVE